MVLNVPHLAIRKDIATKAFHELMNFDFVIPLPGRLPQVVSREDQTPSLTGPGRPNPSFTDDTPAFRALGQLTFSLMSARALCISR